MQPTAFAAASANAVVVVVVAVVVVEELLQLHYSRKGRTSRKHLGVRPESAAWLFGVAAVAVVVSVAEQVFGLQFAAAAGLKAPSGLLSWRLETPSCYSQQLTRN